MQWKALIAFNEEVLCRELLSSTEVNIVDQQT